MSRAVVAAVACLGVAVLLYPSAADWYATRAHAAEVTDYVERVHDVPGPERTRLLASAREYNSRLPGVPLGDPPTTSAGDARDPDVAAYLDQLATTQTMARLRIPAIDADLPVYHGTDEQTLARGVGHLYGSSLPVGGPGTHAVLTGHAGLVGTTVFDRLHELTRGDHFTITVQDEVLTYEVDQILTVEPDDTDALRPTPGRDQVTLVTCTPIGVNSHRLLVRGERVPTVPQAPETVAAMVAAGTGFPWWTLGVLAVPAAYGVGTLLPRSRRRKPCPTQGDGVSPR
ncbi:class C sortase [Xylanimonas allomyrinae]|uniref:class C sortase n=1 Tax=Xylanimonas allomyrinae TaxID=2509459 RepID=UPI0013A61E21|nr:class C sortase [Xylanimonas allomyrinae]